MHAAADGPADRAISGIREGGFNVTTLHRGHVFHISGSPTSDDSPANLVEFENGCLAVDDEGIIEWCGDWGDLPDQLAGSAVEDHRPGFLLPGFVDTHHHFPQVYSRDAFGGGQLLEWLDACIFPGEAKLADPEFGATAAVNWCNQMISVGTTTSLVFGSQFPATQDALFAAVREAGLRIVSGRTIQTVGPASAEPLTTSEDAAIELTRAEIEKWHPLDEADRRHALIQVAVVPRFGLSVTTRTLAALGELYDEYRDRGVYFTSHLNENNRPVTGEVDSVKSQFQVDSYLDVWDGRFLPGSRPGGPGFLGPRSVMAHGVHCKDGELARMAETGTSISHCPVSQFFLGSGTMPWRRTIASGVNVAIGTDMGAGDVWFIPQVLNSCFKAHISEPGEAGLSLHPAELLFLGTLAGARALDLEDRIGNFDPGKEADFVVVEPQRDPSFERIITAGTRPTDAEHGSAALLFAVLLAASERALAAPYVRGSRLQPIPDQA